MASATLIFLLVHIILDGRVDWGRLW